MNREYFPIICNKNGYCININDEIIELNFGQIAVELSELDIAIIKSIFLKFPDFNKKATTNSLGEYDDFTEESYVWLKTTIFNSFSPVTASILLVWLCNYLFDFFEDEEYEAVAFESLNNDPKEEKLKIFVFKDTGYSGYGCETWGQLLLSSLYKLSARMLILIGALKNLAIGNIETVVSSFSNNMLGGFSFSSHFSYSMDKINLIYEIDDILTALIIDVSKIIENNVIIKMCENCGKFFMPENRSDEIYCRRTSPQDSKRTCKEYGSRKLWYDKLKQDEAFKLARNIYTSKQMLSRRNPDIQAYSDMFEYFRQERKQWEDAVKKGEKTRDEYIQWLNIMKAKKTLNTQK